MESLGPASRDYKPVNTPQPASKKRKLDHLDTSLDGSGSSLPSVRVSQVPPRARAKRQRPRYPHLHSEPPSFSLSPNIPSATHTGAGSVCEPQNNTVACVAYKTITPNDHEHAVDTKFGLLLKQVQEVKAEAERCRSETDRRRVERERELERSFEQRRAQREQEFEKALEEREQALVTRFVQREKELKREFGLMTAKLDTELGSLKKDVLTHGATIEGMQSDARKQGNQLRTAQQTQHAAYDSLNKHLKDVEEALREADQELADVKTHRDALLDTLSRVVTDEKKEIRMLRDFLQGFDVAASDHTAEVTADLGDADDDDDTASTTSSGSARRCTTSSDSDCNLDRESRFTRHPRRPLGWQRSQIKIPKPSDLPLVLANGRAKYAALVRTLCVRHKSAEGRAHDLRQRVKRQSVDHNEALQAIKKELTETRARLKDVEESRAKLENGLDNVLRQRTKLENLVEAQKGFEQEARRNQWWYGELKAMLMDERKASAEAKEKLASELEGTRNKLSAMQESLTSAKAAKSRYEFYAAAARGEVEELQRELEQLKSAVNPQQHRARIGAGLRVGHSDQVEKSQREAETRQFALKHVVRRMRKAEAALVQFHLGVGILSSTLCEMLKDLKWSRKVKLEDDDHDTHDLWDVTDAYKRLLNRHGDTVEAIPEKEDYYGDLGCPLCPSEKE